MKSKEIHVNYIKESIRTKNILYYLTEPMRMSTVYWSSNSLKILKDPYFDHLRPAVIKFVKSCMNTDGGFGGNVGLPSTVLSTFTALQILFIHGVPYYSRKTVDYILSMQLCGGGFVNDEFLEKDTRFDCCAVLSLHLLSIMKDHFGTDAEQACFLIDNEEALDRGRLKEPIPDEFLDEIRFDKNTSIRYLLTCYNTDGGFGQLAGSESHAAQVFCCLSALRSLGGLDSVDRAQIEDFLVFRQCPNGGLNGRINKKEDVCYSFWAFAAVQLLGADSIDRSALMSFIYECEGENGGFSDRKGNECDLYHLMFSLASLSLMQEEGLREVDPGFAL